MADKPHAERRGKRHDLVRAESFAITDIHFRPAHHLLEVTHHVQMTDKTHRSLF